MDDRSIYLQGKDAKIVTEFDDTSRDKIAEVIEIKNKEFFLSPILEDFIYTTTRALDVGDYHGTIDKKSLWEHAVNKNSDLFNWDELNENMPNEQGGFPRYLTYRTAGVFLNHESSNPELAIGLVFDSTLIKDPYEDMHAVILMGIDKKKAPNVARSLMTYPSRVGSSMGCSIQSSVCTVCGHRIFKESDFCNCLKYSRGARVKGVKSAELLEKMAFHEQSIVTTPAAPKSMVIDAIHGSGLVPGKILKIASMETETTDPILRAMSSIYTAIKEASSITEKKRLNNQLDALIHKLEIMLAI